MPGSSPGRFEKAQASAADAVVIDLEDAVAPEGKAEAREHARAWLAAGSAAVVRINGSDTPWHDEDVAMAAEHGCPVMLPKSERGEQVAELGDRLGAGAGLVPLIETAAGVSNAERICRAAGVIRCAFGSVDFATQLGVDHEDHEALRFARSQLVLASHAVGVAAPLDGVTTAVRDADRLAEDCAHARSLGMTGKLCIHPCQVPDVVSAFTPTDEQLEWARRVLWASGAGGAVTVLDGALIDKPVVDRARAVLARVGETGPGAGE